MEEAFLVAIIPKYSTRPLSRRTSSPKIVPLATALIRSVTRKDISNPDWKGRVFEAAILATLSRTTLPLSYWKEGQLEVDAIVEIEGQAFAIEIKS